MTSEEIKMVACMLLVAIYLYAKVFGGKNRDR
jgi:hypothetical protein